MPDKIREKPVKPALTFYITWFLIIVFFLIMIVSQIVMKLRPPIKTEVALFYELTEDLRFKGVYIRDERQIAYPTTGIVAYTGRDGSKLAINSVVAKIYTKKEDIFAEHRINEIEERVKALSDAAAFAGTDNSQLDSFMGQLAEKHLQILNSIDAGDYEKAVKYKNEYMSLRGKINVVKGVADNYSDKITELEAEIAQLKAKITEPQDLTISESGYFVSIADGYEDILRYADAPELTREQIEGVIKNPLLPVSPDVVGKIVDSYKWRMAAVLDVDKARTVYEGKKVDLIIGSSKSRIEAKVELIRNLKDGTALYIFGCDLLTDEYVGKRIASVRMLLDDYSGIRISQSAIRFNEQGERGVFILSGSVIKFKKINLIHTEEDFAIAENTDEAGYLKLFDSVIVGGKDLYDGKIVG